MIALRLFIIKRTPAVGYSWRKRPAVRVRYTHCQYTVMWTEFQCAYLSFDDEEEEMRCTLLLSGIPGMTPVFGLFLLAGRFDEGDDSGGAILISSGRHV
jgi:hypothetical protein